VLTAWCNQQLGTKKSYLVVTPDQDPAQDGGWGLRGKVSLFREEPLPS